MSKPSQDFRGILPTKDKRPRFVFGSIAGTRSFIRDQLTISTWLCIGAILQGTLFLIFGRLSMVPAAALVLFRVARRAAIVLGFRRNVFMDDVIMNKFSAQFPNEIGEYGNKPADSEVVVFLIGARCNHPLGALAPGFLHFAEYFPKMTDFLNDHADEFGFLGMTSWLNMGERATGSEIMSVCYFRTVEGLHRYAHSPSHREGWDWWNRSVKDIPHISIFHETYHVPKGHWEAIAINSHANGINSTTFRITDKATGADAWASPVVDASRGLLKTSAGRMSRSNGDEHEKYGTDPYQ